MSARKVELEFPFGHDFPPLYCPVCGTVAQIPDEPSEMPTCPHVEFRFLGMIGEFDYTTPQIDKLLDEWEEKYGDDDEVESLEYIEKDNNKTRIIFEITTGGMACGPSWSTVVYGFNYLPENV